MPTNEGEDHASSNIYAALGRSYGDLRSYSERTAAARADELRRESRVVLGSAQVIDVVMAARLYREDDQS